MTDRSLGIVPKRCPQLAGYDPLSPEQLRDPYAMWRLARAQAPVFFDEGLGMWSITRLDDVLAVIRDTHTFSSAQAFALRHPEFPADLARQIPAAMFEPRMLVSKDPPEHTTLRKLMQRAFTPKRVSGLAPFIQRTCHELIDAFAERDEADLMLEYANPLPLRVITRILGFDAAEAPALRQWTEDFLVLAAPAGNSDQLTSAGPETIERMTRMVAMIKRVTRLVRVRRRNPEDDVISELVAAADADAVTLDDTDLVTLALELVIAGNDTTANLITHMVACLLEDRSQWDDVRQHRELVPDAVEEALRRRGSSKGLFRRATRDVELAGAAIRKGDIVHVLFAAAGHDEAHFDDPTRYDVRRPNAGSHVSFGRWTHFCLGAPLARLEARLALEALLDRLPSLDVVPDQVLAYAPTLTTQTLLGYKVMFEWQG